MTKMYDALEKLGVKIQEGAKIPCESFRDLRHWALTLSSLGYGIAVIGFHDIYENILTVTAVPEDEKGGAE